MKSIAELLAGLVIIILVINMALLALGKMPAWIFFIILAIAALLAYKGIPFLKKKE